MTTGGIAQNIADTWQLIVVAARQSKAKLFCYEKTSEAWQFAAGLGRVCAHVGRNGVTYRKAEGDGCTPAGFYRLGYAFGCREKPATKMAFRPVTKKSFWVDDPKSRYYNTWVEGCEGRDWASAECLYDNKDSYAYAVVIHYNTVLITPGKGSAIFLHCGTQPTAGCVAVPEAVMFEILKWLDPKKSPGILITKN